MVADRNINHATRNLGNPQQEGHAHARKRGNGMNMNEKGFWTFIKIAPLPNGKSGQNYYRLGEIEG